MVGVLRAVARFFQETIGWNRIGVMLSIAIISVAVVVLFHMLRDIDVDEVIAALKATDPKHIAAAAFFVACGYFTLTFYDWFALRTIGRGEVPYRIAALAGFTSYSIGHNIGATVFTGGAVRYRIYSAYGLDAIEVAKICFVAGLTFWLGNATVLGLGVTYHPQAAGPIDQLPDWLNRGIGIAILLVLISYVALGVERPARNRPARMEGRAAERTVHFAADRHRHPRSRLLCARHVHAVADTSRISASSRWRWSSCRRRCSALPVTRPAGSACSMPPCWWRCGNSTRRSVLAGLLLFRLLYYIVPFALALDHSGYAGNLAELERHTATAGTRGDTDALSEPIRSEIESKKTDAS